MKLTVAKVLTGALRVRRHRKERKGMGDAQVVEWSDGIGISTSCTLRLPSRLVMLELHLGRAPARSFGSAAAEYDSDRPAYPSALLEVLAALRPAQALEIGCATGKGTGGLISRGVSVFDVEPDEQKLNRRARRSTGKGPS